MIREQATNLLQAPQAFPFDGLGCSGDDPQQEPANLQETQVGRYLP